ncbi:MAG: hypothetical protein WDN24_18500 [Sphingomonas sp.]
MISRYDWAGGREAMLRFGPAEGPVVVAALPLFEEANRTRAFVVTILRALARRGIAGALPDLPGTGESLLPTRAATLADWRAAYAAAVASLAAPAYGLAIRGGALVDGEAALSGRWHLVPAAGDAQLRELLRARSVADPQAAPVDPDAEGPAVELAGNLVSRTLLRELEAAKPLPARTIRFETDARPADLKLPGSPLWRRAEPGNDAGLAALLADDIAAWVRACEG